MTEPAPDPRMTQNELRELFGDMIPMEVVSKFWTCDGGWTLAELKAWVRGFAAGMKYKPESSTVPLNPLQQYPGPR